MKSFFRFTTALQVDGHSKRSMRVYMMLGMDHNGELTNETSEPGIGIIFLMAMSGLSGVFFLFDGINETWSPANSLTSSIVFDILNSVALDHTILSYLNLCSNAITGEISPEPCLASCHEAVSKWCKLD